jgi:hypothetical protein
MEPFNRDERFFFKGSRHWFTDPIQLRSLQLQDVKLGANELLYSFSPGDSQSEWSIFAFGLNGQIEKWVADSLGSYPIGHLGERQGLWQKAEYVTVRQFLGFDSSALHLLVDLFLVLPLLFRQRFLQAAGKRALVPCGTLPNNHHRVTLLSRVRKRNRDSQPQAEAGTRTPQSCANSSAPAARCLCFSPIQHDCLLAAVVGAARFMLEVEVDFKSSCYVVAQMF